MFMVVARMQKMKASNLVGIGNYNQRKTQNHSNEDIDIQRSHLNYDLVQGRTENYKTDIEKFINEKKVSQRAT
ncbi:plasmid recombination protein [Desemzia sp. RIT 804]|uniref:plasmid recombination protein n=1 Tax=Desemzia sp. RIT 804 TaxID=2810209 RepID=UPI001F37E2D5|nr:plasmid recombination protein [Desemzia sp. RIT 804]